MREFNYVIKDENGIHARPAGELVKTAKKFQSEIKISTGEKSGDLKKIFSVMGLGILKEQNIIISADGVDENEAIKELEEFIKNNL